MDRAMRNRLEGLASEYERLSGEMGSQEVASDPSKFRVVAKAQSDLTDVVQCFQAYQLEEQRLHEAETILREESDAELCQMAEEERQTLTQSLEEREERLRFLLLPKDPNDEKNTIVEIRAGTGGDEAALFVADLYRMYCRFADVKGWRVEVLGSHPTGIGGYKEISFKVSGDSVYSQMKYEGGVHRVQRVPTTEAQGRIHTSACTVAVLPEAEEVEVAINTDDLQIDVYRSSGAGGQHVNTTDSAVRITHVPTGIVVTCQDEKSQHKNKAKALLVLRARLFAQKQNEDDEARSAERKLQVGSGDRSERIRTYNFPQNRLTDHRINLTMYNLDLIVEGALQDVIDALIGADRMAQLAGV